MSDKNIYQRILGVMNDIAYVQKEDKRVNNQYTFVSHDQVSRVLHPILVEHGIVVIPSVKAWHQDGNRTSVDVTVSFVNADKPEDCVLVETFGFGIDPQDKGPGKAMSYATKYAMLKTFVLETGDDPERDNIDHDSEEAMANVAKAKTALDKGDWLTLCIMDRDHETWQKVWAKLGSKDRKAMKDCMAARDKYRDELNALVEAEDVEGFSQVNFELNVDQARHVATVLSDAAKALMIEQRQHEKEAA